MKISITDLELKNQVTKIELFRREKLILLEVKNIIRCKSDNSYTEFLFLDDSYRKKSYSRILVSKGFYHFEDILMSAGTFYRKHNQHIINVNFLAKIIKINSGYIVMDDNTNELVPIARSRKKEFLNFLKQAGLLT